MRLSFKSDAKSDIFVDIILFIGLPSLVGNHWYPGLLEVNLEIIAAIVFVGGEFVTGKVSQGVIV